MMTTPTPTMPTTAVARCAHAPSTANRTRALRGAPAAATRRRGTSAIRAGTNFELLLPGDDAFERISANAAASDAVVRAGKQKDASSVIEASVPVPLRAARGIIARWRVDARFGRKTAATDALREWAREIAPAAGIDPERFTFYSSHIGGRDCAIEMEIDGFKSVGEVDAFFAAIPREAHADWTRAFAEFVVDGSTEWVIMRTSGVGSPLPRGARTAVANAPPPPPPVASKRATMSMADVDEDALVVGQTLPDGRQVVADWKGDPMVLNPGDRMPRF